MTGNSHRQFGYAWAAAAAFTLEPFIGYIGVAGLFVGARSGCTAPDWLEFGVIPHRTITHLPLVWLALIVASVATINQIEPTNFISGVLIGFTLAALSHWVGDVGTPMGVPLVRPSSRVTLRLWGTGRLSEKKPIIVAWAVVFVIFYARTQFSDSAWIDALNSNLNIKTAENFL